jgi:hypothetical protein
VGHRNRSETAAVPKSQGDAVTKGVQKIVFPLVILVPDPKAFDLINKVIS